MYSPRKTIQNTPKNAKNWKLKKFPFEMVSLLWGGISIRPEVGEAGASVSTTVKVCRESFLMENDENRSIPRFLDGFLAP